MNPVGTDEGYRDYYDRLSEYECLATGPGSGMKPHETERYRLLAERVSPNVPNRTARIIEVGCASGGLRCAPTDAGYKHLYGVDQSEACVQTIRRDLGLELAEARDVSTASSQLQEVSA